MFTSVLTYEDNVSCLSASSTNLLVGLYTGHVAIDDTSRKSSTRVHKNPCRAVIFHDNQSKIISGSSKGHLGIVDTGTFKLERKFKVQNSAISSLLSLDSHKIVCGNDDGNIFAYDLRTRSDEPVVKLLDAHNDYIVKVLAIRSQNTILSVSGNGTLNMIDTRKWTRPPQTMSIDEEILSCCLVDSPDEQCPERVLLATDSGSLIWFDWNAHDNFSQKDNNGRVQANGMISIDTKTILLGCEDGCIHSMNVDSAFKKDSTPIHSIDDESIENIVFMSGRQTVAFSTMDKCVHTFPYASHPPNLQPIQPRNFFDDLVE